MKFMLVVYGTRPAVGGELASDGVDPGIGTMISLATPSTATCIRVRAGQRQVTSGPAMETSEQIIRCFIVDASSMDDAIAMGKRIPIQTGDTVEVRRLFELEGLPEGKSHTAVSDESLMMLISFDDEKAWADAGPDALRGGMAEAVALSHQLDQRGQYLIAAPLEPSSTGACVRVRDGQQFVTDGPFVETREVLGGYYLISVKSLEVAISIAEQHPGVRFGTAELRRVSGISH